LTLLFERWRKNDLADSGRDSPYTAEAAARQLVLWAREARQHHTDAER
jgi:hypothetical protein